MPQALAARSRKAVDEDRFAVVADFERVRERPPRVVGAAAVSQEVDALVRGTDPPSRCLGEFASIGAVDQDVGLSQQRVDNGVAFRTEFVECPTAEDHHREPSSRMRRANWEAPAA